MARDLHTQLTTAIGNVTTALQNAYNLDLSDFTNSSWKKDQEGFWDGVSDQISGDFGHTVEVPVVIADEPWFAMMGGVDTDQHVAGYQAYLENLKVLMYAKWETNPAAAIQIGTQSLDGGGFGDGVRDLFLGSYGTADVGRDQLTISGPGLKTWASTEYLDDDRARAPQTLGDAAEDWGTINSVELQPLHDHVSQMQVPTLWSGPGAEAYSKGIQPQGEAIGQIVTLVGQVNSILATGGNGLESLYLAVIQTFDKIELDIQNCAAGREDIGPRMRTALTSVKYALRYLQQDLSQSVAEWGGTIEDAQGQATDALEQDTPFRSHGGAWPTIADISDMEPSAAMPGGMNPTLTAPQNPATTTPPAATPPPTAPGTTYSAPSIGTIKD
ncbi:hypothetical protein [Granulicoccus phenolivorans]|uniref:hypothetical protein n=1 Tax=Granulicoccus phenolivorans TaxID=266854 RepID=UPI00041D2717|nr:hypothetical protein [Granulicoccus phenolivorans]